MVKGIENTEETPTLQETVEAAFDEHVTDAPEVLAEPSPDVPRETPEITPDEPKLDAKGRLRGPDGKYVKKIDEVLEDPIVDPEVIEAIPAPGSWKKEHHEKWTAIDPAIQAYIKKRESEYASGVSTYKAEFDQVRPLSEAIAPFMEDLKVNNIDPGQWISSLGNAHVTLAKGSPEQKLSMFMKLANDYQVPVQSLFAQGEDGKLYYNPQIQQHRAPQPDVNEIVESKIAEIFSQQQITQFAEAKDTDGNPLYPHYETVRETMAQLLESGLAEDLTSAYEAALRHPRHAEIYDEISKQETASAEAAKAAEIKAETERARGNAISVKSATPAVTSSDSPKGVRGSIESAFDEVAGTGRI